MNTRIFSEWLPGNQDYELSGNATVEWYDCVHGEMTDPDYHSAIWVPVKKKGCFFGLPDYLDDMISFMARRVVSTSSAVEKYPGENRRVPPGKVPNVM